jgi:hypothetical protein
LNPFWSPGLDPAGLPRRAETSWRASAPVVRELPGGRRLTMPLAPRAGTPPRRSRTRARSSGSIPRAGTGPSPRSVSAGAAGGRGRHETSRSPFGHGSARPRRRTARRRWGRRSAEHDGDLGAPFRRLRVFATRRRRERNWGSRFGGGTAAAASYAPQPARVADWLAVPRSRTS